MVGNFFPRALSVGDHGNVIPSWNKIIVKKLKQNLSGIKCSRTFSLQNVKKKQSHFLPHSLCNKIMDNNLNWWHVTPNHATLASILAWAQESQYNISKRVGIYKMIDRQGQFAVRARESRASNKYLAHLWVVLEAYFFIRKLPTETRGRIQTVEFGLCIENIYNFIYLFIYFYKNICIKFFM